MEFGIRRQLYFCAFGFAVGVLLLLAGAWTDINVLIVGACLMVVSAFIGGWLLYNNEVPTRKQAFDMHAQIHHDMPHLFEGQNCKQYRNVCNGILYNVNGNLVKVFLVSDHVSKTSIMSEYNITSELSLAGIGVQLTNIHTQTIQDRVYYIIHMGKIGRTLNECINKLELWDNHFQQFVIKELDKIWNELPKIDNMTSITIHLEDLMLHTTDDGTLRLLLFDYSTAVYGEDEFFVNDIEDELYTNINQLLPRDSEVRNELISYFKQRRVVPN